MKMYTKSLWCRMNARTAAIVVSLCGLAATAQAQNAICARVGVQIQQEAVISRNAFRATLQLNNDGNEPITDISVELDIRTVGGETSNAKFSIRPPDVTGMGNVDGTGSLGGLGAGTAVWTIIPLDEAAPTAPLAYDFGGVLRYTLGGTQVTIPLTPDRLEVLPNPKLRVKYFWEKNVYSDDPFTQEIEPAVPFTVGLMMTNVGAGVANNVRVTSSQPVITENERGLLINFQLIGSQVQDRNVTPSLAVTLGDIAPLGQAGSSKVARWLMTSSLQGRFIEYRVRYEHLDALGDSRLTLIEGQPSIFELIHPVQTQETGDDRVVDFMTNERFYMPGLPGHDPYEDPSDYDKQDLPDTLHRSTGEVDPVIPILSAFAGVQAAGRVVITADVTPDGFMYIKVPDPLNGAYQLSRVVRSDGRELVLGLNAWQTNRIFREAGQQALVAHRLHLFDRGNGSQASYTLFFDGAGVQPQISSWQILANHGDSLIDVPSELAATPEYVEPRQSGIRKIKVNFNKPIRTDSISSSTFSIQGFHTNDVPVDLSGLAYDFQFAPDARSVTVFLSRTLPDRARYCISMPLVQDLFGNFITSNTRRTVYALVGDATGDARTNNTDVGAVQSLVGTQLVDITNARHLRADVNNDGSIDLADRALALASRGADLRAIREPCEIPRQGPKTQDEVVIGPPSSTPIAIGPGPEIRVDPNSPKVPLTSRRIMVESLTEIDPLQAMSEVGAASLNLKESSSQGTVQDSEASFVRLGGDDALEVGYVNDGVSKVVDSKLALVQTTTAHVRGKDIGLIDLNTMLDAASKASGWKLTRATQLVKAEHGGYFILGDGMARGENVRFRLSLNLHTRGDVNMDGLCDAMDVAMVVDSIESGSQQGTDNNKLLDVNGDGQVDTADVAAIRAIAATGKQ